MLENTFFIIKPDGVARGLEAEIFKRIEQGNLKVIAQKKLSLTDDLAANLYSPHLGKHFYPGLLKFMMSGPVICCQAQGKNAILKLREILGATNPEEASPGTIRADLREENIRTAEGIIKNLVHGSDSPESAKREAAIFFGG